MSSPSGPMFLIVAKISMSSDELDTQSKSAMGPVISVSSLRGAVMNDTPVRPIEPALTDGAAEAVPAWLGGLARKVIAVLCLTGSDRSAPSELPSWFCSGCSAFRYILVQHVRAIGHSFSNRNLYSFKPPPVRICSLTGGLSMMPVSIPLSQ